MHLAFDIFQGIGIAAAVGVRPFVPSVAAGALAAAGVEIHFDHTSYSFLQSLPFLLAMVFGTVLLVVLGQGVWGQVLRGRLGETVLGVLSLGLGGLFFAGSLVRDHHAAWPGWAGGVLCAAIGFGAARPFLSRLRSRLDDAAASVGLPVISDGSALLIAVLSIVAPPLGLIALLGLLWLLYSGRGRSDAKYAGLRILR
ncbi:MAG TPA: hypothetical protein VG228_05365 [Solirubrobacteraceae bacterium]|nr:hypothetical protein [Solirubrobacteraceae bacterium]